MLHLGLLDQFLLFLEVQQILLFLFPCHLLLCSNLSLPQHQSWSRLSLPCLHWRTCLRLRTLLRGTGHILRGHGSGVLVLGSNSFFCCDFSPVTKCIRITGCFAMLPSSMILFHHSLLLVLALGILLLLLELCPFCLCYSLRFCIGFNCSISSFQLGLCFFLRVSVVARHFFRFRL